MTFRIFNFQLSINGFPLKFIPEKSGTGMTFLVYNRFFNFIIPVQAGIQFLFFQLAIGNVTFESSKFSNLPNLPNLTTMFLNRKS